MNASRTAFTCHKDFALHVYEIDLLDYSPSGDGESLLHFREVCPRLHLHEDRFLELNFKNVAEDSLI